MSTKKKTLNRIATVFFTIISFFWMFPIILIFYNSLKEETATGTSTIFNLPGKDTFVGLEHYIEAINDQGMMSAFGYSFIISISSVILIIICCSMAGWFIVRVNNIWTKMFYYLCLFSMAVPFQMVMFTLSKTADTLHLDNPYNICIIYLGFGAGLAVFMFTGFVKSVPIEIEEAALIDGCNPLQTYTKVLLPILRPTIISTAILELMWVWNDYLLPQLVLDTNKYNTIPMVIQRFRGSYGHVAMGAMMASIMIDIIPIVIVYLICQKYIIKGVVSGAVKG
jgi:raffinose/stachyose/melibiose transport system permease protein